MGGGGEDREAREGKHLLRHLIMLNYVFVLIY